MWKTFLGILSTSVSITKTKDPMGTNFIIKIRVRNAKYITYKRRIEDATRGKK